MRYDWTELKRRFFWHKKYGAASLRKFATSERIPYGGNFIQKTKNWSQEKEAKRMQNGCKIEEALSEKAVAEAAEIDTRHTRIYHRFLDLLEKACDGTDKDSFHAMRDNLRTVSDAVQLLNFHGQTLIAALKKQNP